MAAFGAIVILNWQILLKIPFVGPVAETFAVALNVHVVMLHLHPPG